MFALARLSVRLFGGAGGTGNVNDGSYSKIPHCDDTQQLAGEHRNVTQFHDIFEDDDYYYLTMGETSSTDVWYLSAALPAMRGGETLAAVARTRTGVCGGRAASLVVAPLLRSENAAGAKNRETQRH